MPRVPDTIPIPEIQPPSKTPKDTPRAGARPPFPIPWGLFIVLGIYGGLVLGYIQLTYWGTDQYKAAEHVDQAYALLATDKFEKLSKETLFEAYGHFLEAARLVPEVRGTHERLQELRYRMDQRNIQLPRELVMRTEAMAVLLQRIDEERAPTLVTGIRDRGWAPDQVLSGPKTVLIWSSPGAVLISIFFFYRSFTERRIRSEEHEAESMKGEQELIDLERARTRSVNKDGSFKERKGDILMTGGVAEKPRPSGVKGVKKPVTKKKG